MISGCSSAPICTVCVCVCMCTVHCAVGAFKEFASLISGIEEQREMFVSYIIIGTCILFVAKTELCVFAYSLYSGKARIEGRGEELSYRYTAFNTDKAEWKHGITKEGSFYGMSMYCYERFLLVGLLALFLKKQCGLCSGRQWNVLKIHIEEIRIEETIPCGYWQCWQTALDVRYHNLCFVMTRGFLDLCQWMCEQGHVCVCVCVFAHMCVRCMYVTVRLRTFVHVWRMCLIVPVQLGNAEVRLLDPLEQFRNDQVHATKVSVLLPMQHPAYLVPQYTHRKEINWTMAVGHAAVHCHLCVFS